ncbi:MAG TPA: SurA N-terminal domain-containing protein, partial [Candidatus Dormibacteraeota bacterium]|nr:SurA N-terminal domain-containing protein [Candidatus Dormibacteraeota bacterium]
MFGTIRKHQTWLWAVIITLTIISFVIFFSPYSRYNQGRKYGDAYYGSVNGERITDTEFRNAQDEVRLEYFFMSGGNWLNNEAEAKKMGFDVEQRIYGRLLLIQKQKQMGIHIGSDVAAQYANEMLRSFEQRSGLPSAEAFVKQVLEPRGLKMDDFDRFVRHQMGIQELMETVAISGKLVTPQEAQSLYVRERQEASTEAVFFSASNYLSQVSVTPEGLSQFYSNQIPNYRIPQR